MMMMMSSQLAINRLRDSKIILACLFLLNISSDFSFD